MPNWWIFIILILCIVVVYFFLRLRDTSYSGWLIMIPGITGDLAKRKLIPALYQLYTKGTRCTIIGTGRNPADIAVILGEAKKFVNDGREWADFSRTVQYHKLDPEISTDFDDLALILGRYKHITKRMVYLAIPSESYSSMTQQLVRCGIVQPHQEHFILYEKPFGSDLASARQINANILSVLPEHQVYRVDHYVAKCLTQRLPSLIDEKRAIESISILMHEKIGIEGRGQFYDRYGAIKDVVQNHMLQLLAFIAEAPSHSLKLCLGERDRACASAEADADEKAKFLRSLIVRNVERRQYEGYKMEKGVSPNSTTETYAAITLESGDEQWKGVTFFLETGKCMPEKRTEIRVIFKSGDTLIIQFAPEESIIFRSGGIEKPITFKEGCADAYQMLLDDVFTGNLKYSVSFPELEAQWQLTDLLK